MLSIALFLLFTTTASAVTPLEGKIIALDAGHGNGETGAVGYCGVTKVVEADVNQAVRAELKILLETDNAVVHEVIPYPSRQDRVADAEDAGSDVLISIHHNGSTNTSADYTQSFVTQKNDKILAGFIQPALVDALKLPDKGIKSDGYGMTVYGSLPGILTESYFVTNTVAACDFVDYLNEVTNTRVQKEAQAMYNGLLNYFSRSTDGSGGGRPNR